MWDLEREQEKAAEYLQRQLNNADTPKYYGRVSFMKDDYSVVTFYNPENYKLLLL